MVAPKVPLSQALCPVVPMPIALAQPSQRFSPTIAHHRPPIFTAASELPASCQCRTTPRTQQTKPPKITDPCSLTLAQPCSPPHLPKSYPGPPDHPIACRCTLSVAALQDASRTKLSECTTAEPKCDMLSNGWTVALPPRIAVHHLASRAAARASIRPFASHTHHHHPHSSLASLSSYSSSPLLASAASRRRPAKRRLAASLLCPDPWPPAPLPAPLSQRSHISFPPSTPPASDILR